MRKRLVRDHSQPCEHSKLNAHLVYVRGESWCPGGREIKLEEIYVIDSYDDDSEYIPPGAWSAWVEVGVVE